MVIEESHFHIETSKAARRGVTDCYGIGDCGDLYFEVARGLYPGNSHPMLTAAHSCVGIRPLNVLCVIVTCCIWWD